MTKIEEIKAAIKTLVMLKREIKEENRTNFDEIERCITEVEYELITKYQKLTKQNQNGI